MPIRTKQDFYAMLAAVYQDGGTSQALKDRIGLFFLRNAPDRVSDANLMAYWTALGVTKDDIEEHLAVLAAVRARWGNASGGAKTAVRNRIAAIRGSGEPELVGAINDWYRTRIEREETEPAQQAVAGITQGALSAADVDTLAEYWGHLPEVAP